MRFTHGPHQLGIVGANFLLSRTTTENRRSWCGTLCVCACHSNGIGCQCCSWAIPTFLGNSKTCLDRTRSVCECVHCSLFNLAVGRMPQPHTQCFVTLFTYLRRIHRNSTQFNHKTSTRARIQSLCVRNNGPSALRNVRDLIPWNYDGRVHFFLFVPFGLV